MKTMQKLQGANREFIAIGIVAICTLLSGLMVLDRSQRDAAIAQANLELAQEREEAAFDDDLQRLQANEEGPVLSAVPNGDIEQGVTVASHESMSAFPAEPNSDAARYGLPDRTGTTDGPPEGIPSIAALPIGKTEIGAAFETAQRLACKVLPAGQPLRITSTVPTQVKTSQGDVMVPCRREHVISIGLDLLPEDHQQLPTLSGSTILGYLKDHFVSVQLFVGKDSLDGRYFLVPQAVAGTSKFRGGYVTEDTQPVAGNAVKNLRSLGLIEYVDPKSGQRDVNTVAFVKKLELAQGSGGRSAVDYEYVFVRLKQSGDEPRLHVFMTSEGRTLLHDLGRTDRPGSLEQCDIQAKVVFDKYSHGEMVPEHGLTKQFQVKARKSYRVSDLNGALRERNWQGDVWENIVPLLKVLSES